MLVFFVLCYLSVSVSVSVSEFRVQSPHSHSRRKNIAKSNIGQIDSFDKDIDDFDK